MNSKKKIHIFFNQFQRSFWMYFLISVLLEIGLIYLIKSIAGPTLHECFLYYMGDTEFNIYDVFYAQISTTFILISIISLLSTNTQKVYWDDMMHRKLIKPPFMNFTSLTAYLLSTLLISTYMYIVGSNYILLSFVVSLLLMSIFTVRMVGAYFGRDAVKAKMEKEFKSLSAEEQIPYRRKLMEESMTAIDNNEMSVLVENMNLLLPRIVVTPDEIDIYTNAVMSKIKAEKNTFALFSVLGQNNVLWINPQTPFYEHFCDMSFWEGGYYYQKVLLDDYFNQSVLSGGIKDKTLAVFQAVSACLQTMYIEMSKEFCIDNASQSVQLMKNWMKKLQKKGMILKIENNQGALLEEKKETQSCVDGHYVAEYMLDCEDEAGGLYALIEMISNHLTLKNVDLLQVEDIILLYSYTISILQMDCSPENENKNHKIIMQAIKERVPEWQ